MKPYPALLAELLSRELSSLRRQKALTQEAMAEQLRHFQSCIQRSGTRKIHRFCPDPDVSLSMLDAEAQGDLVRQFMDRVQALEGRMQHECRNGHRRSL